MTARAGAMRRWLGAVYLGQTRVSFVRCTYLSQIAAAWERVVLDVLNDTFS